MIHTHHTHPPESAGRLMTERVPVVSISTTVRDVEQYLLRDAKNFDSIDYIYVANHQKELVGVLSIKELFNAPREVAIRDIMTTTLVTARAHTDQERVAYIALRHNIKAVPIIDSARHLLGVVPADDILRVLDHEATENLARLAGFKHVGGFDNILTLPIKTSVAHRLPWLVIGLLGGLMTAGIIGGFEEILGEYLILAAFIPLIVYLADAIGTQMSTFMIRDLALEDRLPFWSYASRQAAVVMMLGGILAALLFLLTVFLYGNLMVSVVLAVALVCASLSALGSGLLVPFLLAKLNFDPANASGPIATIVQDLLSVVIYLSVALLLLS